MKIELLRNLQLPLPKVNEIPKKEESGFGDMLTSLIKDTNQDQIKSANATQDLISGKNIELHEVMIAGEQAKTSLELLMSIRNKAVDMYKELTRIPV